MNKEEKTYVRWAINEALRGQYDEAIKSLLWAQEESEKEKD
jgi:hypothetical protein